MSKTAFYNNPVFRLAAPLLSGIIIYLLILMFFDSVEMLAMNFFSREVLFIIGLTYIFFELNRLVIILAGHLEKPLGAFIPRMALQYAVSFILTVALISSILYLYFVNIEGFSTITTELITFNGIYLFAAIFYHLYYFSIHYLYKQNDEILLTERSARNNLELELSNYKNQINPAFLFHALEIIITELHKSKKNADGLIGQLAGIYRYTLDNQQNELVGLRQEIDALVPALEIFRARHPEAIFINNEVPENDAVYLVPGTLLTLFEHAVIHNLISDRLPLKFNLTAGNGLLLASYNLNERITEPGDGAERIDKLVRTYDHLTDQKFRIYRETNRQVFEIPLLTVEEE